MSSIPEHTYAKPPSVSLSESKLASTPRELHNKPADCSNTPKEHSTSSSSTLSHLSLPPCSSETCSTETRSNVTRSIETKIHLKTNTSIEAKTANKAPTNLLSKPGTPRYPSYNKSPLTILDKLIRWLAKLLSELDKRLFGRDKTPIPSNISPKHSLLKDSKKHR